MLALKYLDEANISMLFVITSVKDRCMCANEGREITLTLCSGTETQRLLLWKYRVGYE